MGTPDVQAMLRGMSARQFFGWLAFDAMNPLGERRGDMRAALVAQLLANINRPKGHRGFELKDFMLHFPEAHEPGKKQTSQDMFNVLMSIARTQNAGVK